MEQTMEIAPYAQVAARLLQGPVFEDQVDLWEQLLTHQTELTAFFGRLALKLMLERKDGYAYLQQVVVDDKGNTLGLMKRQPLSYDLTMVCVFLREWLMAFEHNEMKQACLIITPKAFKNRLEIHFKEQIQSLGFMRDLNRYLSECEKLGFIRLVQRHPIHSDENQYEVKRIIKAKITNRELEQFINQMQDELKSVEN